MACTGAQWCDYICWVPGEVYFCRRVFFDTNVWNFIYSLAKSFIDTPLNEIPLKNEKTLIINTLLLQKLKVLNSHLNIHIIFKIEKNKHVICKLTNVTPSMASLENLKINNDLF
ncbi:hypothetical protein ACTFIW_005528 [Dictyostelium discoideum]